MKRENAYEVWETSDDFNFMGEVGKWTWYVLKKWQADDSKSYARWFCDVVTPMCPNGELGDVYVTDVINNAKRIK